MRVENLALSTIALDRLIKEERLNVKLKGVETQSFQFGNYTVSYPPIPSAGQYL
jgi:hypothetical protein